MLGVTVEHSAEMDKLAEALATAQGNMKNPEKDAENPRLRTRYASLAAIRDACVPPLSEQGIAVTQLIGADEDSVESTLALWHKSGQWLKTTMRLPVLPLARQGEAVPVGDPLTAQAYGLTISYLRRYQLMAVCNLVGEQDDDGEGQARRGADPRGNEQRRPLGPANPGRQQVPATTTRPVSQAPIPAPAPSLLSEIGTILGEVWRPLGAGFYKAACFQAFGCDSMKLKEQTESTLTQGMATFRYLTEEMRKEKVKPSTHPDTWMSMKMRARVDSTTYDPLGELPWSVLREHQANAALPTPLLEDISFCLLAGAKATPETAAGLEEQAEQLAGKVMEWLDSIAETKAATA